MTKWTPREAVIVELLERFNELTDPMQSGNGDGDSGLRLMPATYTPSVRELERLIVKLREERHNVWWHLNERYLKAVQSTAWECPKCKGVSHAATHSHRDKRGKLSSYKGVRVLRTSWSERVNPVKVETGVRWVASEWTLKHEPMLPDVVLAASKKDDQAARKAA